MSMDLIKENSFMFERVKKDYIQQKLYTTQMINVFS